MRPSPVPTQTITSTSSKATYILSKINEYRRSKGLSEVKTDPYTCDFATIRASEITTSFNHDGFNNRIDAKSLPYPSYSQITENIAMNANYLGVAQQWIDSSGHRENMEKDTPFVCVGNSGNYYAYEGWRP